VWRSARWFGALSFMTGSIAEDRPRVSGGGETAGEGNESIALGKISIRAADSLTFELKR
jgi:hypothetical protein